MKTYYVNQSDIIAETMKAVNQKENRRIIDQKDIYHFEQIADTVMRKDGITYLQYQVFPYPFDQCFDICYYDNQFYYVLFPWVRMRTLDEKFTDALPVEVQVSLQKNQEEISDMMPSRDKEELLLLHDAYTDYLDFIQEDMQQALSQHEAKARMLTYRIHMTQNRRGTMQ